MSLTPNEQRRLADYLSEYATGVVEEWMRIVDLDDDDRGRVPDHIGGIQARVRWQSDGTFALSESPYGGDDYGTYRLIVRVEPINVPPLGPEDDPALVHEMSWVDKTLDDVRTGDQGGQPMTTRERMLEIAVLRLCVELYEDRGRDGGLPRVEAGTLLRDAVRTLMDEHGSGMHLLADLDQEEHSLTSYEMSWVDKTLDDVRTGDRINFRGTEAVVESAYRRGWHVHPASKYEVIPLEHDDVCLRRAGREKLYVLKPDLPVKIQLTDHEIAALDAMGWENRVCVITERMYSQLTNGQR